RVISVHKANTANAFSTNEIGVASGNLYSASTPGGAAFGYQLDNYRVDVYAGKATKFGTGSDPMIGKRVGGFDTNAGGLALYDENKQKVGAIGVSGDTLCANHVIAWKIRERLGNGAYKSTNVPFGLSASLNDMLIQDIIQDTTYGAPGYSPSTYGHPRCRNNPTVEQAAGSIEFH
ncbi:MAG: GlcG/HbpS family heme-binding protein, partial [Methylococcales bacterium]